MCDKEEMSLLLSRLVDGDLTPQERGEVLRHVAECPDCAQDLEDLKLLHQFYLAPPPPAALKRQVLQAAREERPPRGRRLLRRAVPLAAAACLVLTCALTLRFFPWKQDSAGNGASPADAYALYGGSAPEADDETSGLREMAKDAGEGEDAVQMDGAVESPYSQQSPLATGTPEFSLYVLLPVYSETAEFSQEESVITYADAEDLWPGDLENPADSYVKIVLPEQQLNTYVAAYSEGDRTEDVAVISVEENTSGYGVLLMPAQ